MDELTAARDAALREKHEARRRMSGGDPRGRAVGGRRDVADTKTSRGVQRRSGAKSPNPARFLTNSPRGATNDRREADRVRRLWDRARATDLAGMRRRPGCRETDPRMLNVRGREELRALLSELERGARPGAASEEGPAAAPGALLRALMRENLQLRIDATDYVEDQLSRTFAKVELFERAFGGDGSRDEPRVQRADGPTRASEGRRSRRRKRRKGRRAAARGRSAGHGGAEERGAEEHKGEERVPEERVPEERGADERRGTARGADVDLMSLQRMRRKNRRLRAYNSVARRYGDPLPGHSSPVL
jgi:hypothetical protein